MLVWNRGSRIGAVRCRRARGRRPSGADGPEAIGLIHDRRLHLVGEVGERQGVAGERRVARGGLKQLGELLCLLRGARRAGVAELDADLLRRHFHRLGCTTSGRLGLAGGLVIARAEESDRAGRGPQLRGLVRVLEAEAPEQPAGPDPDPRLTGVRVVVLPHVVPDTSEVVLDLVRPTVEHDDPASGPGRTLALDQGEELAEARTDVELLVVVRVLLVVVLVADRRAVRRLLPALAEAELQGDPLHRLAGVVLEDVVDCDGEVVSDLVGVLERRL